MDEARLAFSKALCADGQFDGSDVSYIVEEKKQILRKTGSLTFEQPGAIDDVGGLERLKEWLGKRRGILTERARRYGIPAPGGVLLTGIPGCGKTLCARAMASIWRVPLLRLDMGSIYAGLLGSSEANMRKAIRCAEAMAPCILMIDVIEKALAGVGGHTTDGGTSPRVFGTLLSWMSDKTLPVFVVATANSFERLPPEMLRKGRFDEIFFVDFPHAVERRAILTIHLRQRGRNPGEFDLDALVTRTRDFTGSEIEQAVVSGMIEAFADGERPFTTDDIVAGIASTVPLIDTMRDQVDAIRRRARECTVPASLAAERE
jgi:SpoVK/Ycf46/Vps4 family AAA+-type ATPase